MITSLRSRLQDRPLQLAFALLIILTLGIGIVGILQVEGLGRKVENLGKLNLQLEKAILEMRVNNAIFATGVRNYALWRTSRYISAASASVNLKNILEAGERFRKQLKVYQDVAYLAKQRERAVQVGNSFNELSFLGKQIIDAADRIQAGMPAGQAGLPAGQAGASQEKIDSMLMAFENRLYRIDDFLDNTMGKENLNEIERQMDGARKDKQRTILFLSIILFIAVSAGILIAKSVSRRLDKERTQREELFNQLINMEESERKNLSTAIHDEMGQDLSALKIYLGLLGEAIACLPQEAKDKLEKTKKIVSGLIEKSHNIAFLLRPPDLDEIGLVESLEAMLLEYKHLVGVNYIYEKPRHELRLPSEYSLVIYRIAQELLNNMAKHAKAKNVEIRLVEAGNSLEFFYQDNGLGFDYEAVQQHPHRRKEDKLRLGLLSLRERVELLNGSMRIDASPGAGMRVFVKLPRS